jgi:replicative DNA helicase
MKTLQELTVYLDEIKAGIVPFEEVENIPISDAEKLWILQEFKKWDTERLRQPTSAEIYADIDPIKKKNVLRTWGSPLVDSKISPIQDHAYTIFAGEQGSGKTAFTFDLALKNSAMGKVLYISLEMAKAQIVSRIARAYAGMTKAQWREKKFEPWQEGAYRAKSDQIQNNKNLKIIGYGAGETPTIESILDKIKSEFPILAFVDNFDLVAKQERNQIDHERVISRKFMEFCHQWNIPIIVIHHTNKTKEKTKIDAIRGSGKITDDADAVIMGRRITDEQASPLEKKKFSIFELKDREFGENGYHDFQFEKGTFVDFQDTIGFNAVDLFKQM